MLYDLFREADQGNVTLFILLDFSEAFDTINHGLLLYWLAMLRIGVLALSLVLPHGPSPDGTASGGWFDRSRSSAQYCLTSI